MNVFPDKDQAIILGGVDDLKLSEYVSAVGILVQPKNVVFASRIANNRICVYLSSKSLVDKVVTDHPVLTIQNHLINVRRLINPARRIILSNVCPSIPHDIFVNSIKTLGFTVISPMTFLRAGLPGDEYAHVLSFRRQIFVQPDDNIELPSSLLIKFEGTKYRIFLSCDNVCYKCRQLGHIANDCPQNNEANAERANAQTEPIFPEQNTPTNDIPRTSSAAYAAVVTSNKRTKDSSPVEDAGPLDFSLKSPDSLGNLDTEETSHKKLKPSESLESLTSLAEKLIPAKQIIENTDHEFPLDFDQLIEVMDNINQQPDPIEYLLDFTSNIGGVIFMLHEIYPALEYRNVKSRCLNIQRKLRKALSRQMDMLNTAESNTGKTQTTASLSQNSMSNK